MANEQTTSKIRNALQQLDPANDQHWTEDGLPREGVVRTLANDPNISRAAISAASPGFQRNPTKPTASAAVQEIDALTGEPILPPGANASPLDSDEDNEDPTKNTGELMTDDEVRVLLEQRVTDAARALTDAQAAVRAANQGVLDAQAHLQKVKGDLSREFPPMTAAQNVKQYIASELAGRAAMHHNYGGGNNGIAPGSQIDAAMQRGNSRGWRRPSRNGQTQTGAART